jgi:hypothetical protein
LLLDEKSAKTTLKFLAFSRISQGETPMPTQVYLLLTLIVLSLTPAFSFAQNMTYAALTGTKYQDWKAEYDKTLTSCPELNRRAAEAYIQQVNNVAVTSILTSHHVQPLDGLVSPSQLKKFADLVKARNKAVALVQVQNKPGTPGSMVGDIDTKKYLKKFDASANCICRNTVLNFMTEERYSTILASEMERVSQAQDVKCLTESADPL